MKNYITFSGLVLVLVYACILIVMYAYQRPMLYTSIPDTSSPQSFGILDAEEVTINTPDGEKLAAWFKTAQAGKPTVIYYHGKGGNIGFRSKRWLRYAPHSFGLVFVDYRGFGNSSGQSTEAGLKIDALATYDWLRAKGIPPQEVILSGESLGTGLALYVAANREVARISLMSAYSSIADVAAARYWWAPVRIILKDQFEMLDIAKQVKAPVLQQHGEDDITIPVVFGQRVFDAIEAPKTLHRLKAIGHNNFGDAEFKREIDFINGLN